MKKVLFAISLIASVSVAQAAEDQQSRENISKRLAPVGQLHIGDPSAQVATGPRSGDDVYKVNCFACHGTGAMGAPKKGDASWDERMKKGLDAVVANAINGFNTMPARGTCAACSDEEIKAAVEYMIK